jgi:hypothetical protein
VHVHPPVNAAPPRTVDLQLDPPVKIEEIPDSARVDNPEMFDIGVDSGSGTDGEVQAKMEEEEYEALVVGDMDANVHTRPVEITVEVYHRTGENSPVSPVSFHSAKRQEPEKARAVAQEWGSN